MKLPLFLTLVSSALLLPQLQAAETTYAPVNPALLYWQAAAVLPKLSDDQAAKIRDMARGTIPAEASTLDALETSSAETVLRKAAVSPAACDWGLLREDGPFMLMPHLSKIRELANIATARAEVL